MPNRALTYFPLSDPADRRALAVEQIYLEAFRDDERARFGELFELLTRPKAGVRSTLGAFEWSGEVVGMGSALHYAERNLGYLAYLAVRGDMRGRGFGSQVAQFLLNWADEQAHQTLMLPPRLTFWEVRHPAAAYDEEEKLESERRIHFYRRLGAVSVPIAYRCPSIGPGQPDMTYLPMAHTYPPGRSLTRAEALDVAWQGVVLINGAGPDSDFWVQALRSVDENWPE